MSIDYPDFLGSEIEASSMNDAAFSVLPVPYERSVSYGGGTALGPSSILRASWQLETWDGRSNPSLGGIHTCLPLDCQGEDADIIEGIARSVAQILTAGSMPVILGGEHSITYGSIKGLMDAGVKDFGIVQIDAHADLRDAYEGNPYSHASVMKRVVDENIPIMQLGVRAICEEEIQVRSEHSGIYFQDAEELVQGDVQSIQFPDDFPSRVFLTLDVDGLDPSVFPSTGTPVPGGLGWYQVLNMIESITRGREVIAFDVVEHAPVKDFHAYDFAAALLVYKVMGIIMRSS